MELIFLCTGIILGFFLDKSRLAEKKKETQEKINTKIKKIKKSHIQEFNL